MTLRVDYIELHPGGRQILRDAGVKDVVEDFNKYHAHNQQAILAEVEQLCVGRLVPTRPTGTQPSASEIIIRENVHDLGKCWTCFIAQRAQNLTSLPPSHSSAV